MHINEHDFDLHSAVGVTVVDSGNYTCEIRTPEGNILGGVTHSLFVRGKSISWPSVKD